MAEDFVVKGKVTLDTGEAKQATGDLTQDFSTLFESTTGVSLGIAAVGAAAIGAAVAINTLTEDAYEAYCEFDRLGYTIGITAGEMAKWNQVAIYSDSTGSSLATMLGKLSVNLSDTEISGERARQVMADMGISVYDAEGNLRPLTELFPEMVGGLDKVTNASERNGMAMDLVGRGYKDLAGYMILGQAGIQQVLAESSSLTDKQQKDLGLLEERYKDLGRTMSETGNVLGAELSPAVEELINSINTLLELDDGKFFRSMVEGIHLAVDAFTILVRGITLACIGIEYLQALTKGDFTGAEAIRQKGITYVAEYTAKDRESAFDEAWEKAGGASATRGGNGGTTRSGTTTAGTGTTEINEYGGAGVNAYGPVQVVNLKSQGSAYDNLNADGTVNYGSLDQTGSTGVGLGAYTGQPIYGDQFAQVEAIWAAAMSERATSPYIQAILELAKAKGQSITGDPSDTSIDWKYATTSGAIASATLSNWEAYKNTPSINLTVYATGSDQQIANDTAMAVSRALAAQVRT